MRLRASVWMEKLHGSSVRSIPRGSPLPISTLDKKVISVPGAIQNGAVLSRPWRADLVSDFDLNIIRNNVHLRFCIDRVSKGHFF